jgi:hypothetical protein
MEEDRSGGAVAEISREHARLGELGYVLMFRDLGQVHSDHDELVEGVPAHFKAENGDPGLSMWIGEDYYVTRLDDVEVALKNPLPAAVLEEDPPDPDIFLSREECLEQQGTLLMVRWAREVEGEEDFYQPLVSRFVERGPGYIELSVGRAQYGFLAQDFWAALTDPATFRRDEEGPLPIDVLRGPIDQKR